MGRIRTLLILGALGASAVGCGSSGNSVHPSTTTLSSSINPVAVGEAVTFTAVVSGQSGTPTGTVNFDVNGSESLGVTLTGGTATFPSTFNSSGSASVTANYSGDGTYSSSTSAAFTQTVDPDVVTVSGSPQQPLTQDGSGNFVAVVTITNTGNVTVDSLQVMIAGTTLGSGSLISAPAAVTNLAPGASTSVTLSFPSNSVPSGTTTAQLSLSGTYSALTGSLSGNWGLTFRSVSL
ncbi:MAG TPA: Ig-like domain-containing protein [Candidatus Sulfotelmatobacter sp.]|nr:Ig-like domain-containing protein [Candidatus Sulfotelmatobacter sp.]